MRYDGPGFYGLNPPLWISGAAQQPAGQWVTSPADKEVYQRIAATNSSTTDPADDTTNYLAMGYERTVALPDGGLFAGAGTTSSNIGRGATLTSLAAISTSVRTSILSVTGRGCIDYFAFLKAAAGTTRIEVICDGRTILDQTPTFTSTTVLLALGVPSPNSDGSIATSFFAPDPKGVEFRRSLQVYLTNTATASNTSAGIAYHLRSRG